MGLTRVDLNRMRAGAHNIEVCEYVSEDSEHCCITDCVIRPSLELSFTIDDGTFDYSDNFFYVICDGCEFATRSFI